MDSFKCQWAPPTNMAVEEPIRGDAERELGRKVIIIATLWTLAATGAGVLLILFRDFFAGL